MRLVGCMHASLGARHMWKFTRALRGGVGRVQLRSWVRAGAGAVDSVDDGEGGEVYQ